MIDIALLATSAVSALAPYLVKGGQAIAGEAGKDLYSWVKKQLGFAKKDKELKALEEKPEDAKVQGRVEAILEGILENNDGLAQELTALVEKAQKESVNIIGSKNVVNAPITSGKNTIVGDGNQAS